MLTQLFFPLAAIQVLKLSGFSKIIATASLRNTDLLESLGATHVIDRNADLASEVKKALNGETLDLIYDVIGTKEIQTQAVELLVPGGQFIAVALVQVDKAAFPDKHFVTVYADFRLPQYWALGKSLASNLHDLLASGAIKVREPDIKSNVLPVIDESMDVLSLQYFVT